MTTGSISKKCTKVLPRTSEFTPLSNTNNNNNVIIKISFYTVDIRAE